MSKKKVDPVLSFLRFALTGNQPSLPLHLVMMSLGKEESLRRIHNAFRFLFPEEYIEFKSRRCNLNCTVITANVGANKYSKFYGETLLPQLKNWLNLLNNVDKQVEPNFYNMKISFNERCCLYRNFPMFVNKSEIV